MAYLFSMIENDRYENEAEVAISIDESIFKVTIASPTDVQYYNVSPSEMKKLYEFLQANQDLFVVPEVEEEIPVTYGMIRNTVGWSRFCDVTGNNHYSINEFGHYDSNFTFNITKSQFNELW